MATLQELADLVGIRQSRTYNWPKRGGIPADALAEIAKKLGKPIHAFEPNEDLVQLSVADLSGSEMPGTFRAESRPAAYGFQLDEGSSEPAPPVLTWRNDGHSTRFQVVPRFAVRASAGYGNGQVDEEQIGEVAFEVNWMRRHLGRSGRGFASIEVRGDSMQPTLINGDEIIIDKTVHRVDVNGIYVIALRGDLLVKRVQRMLDGSLVVKSDNPAYEPESIGAERAEDFRVVGRMVWPRVR